MRAIHPPYLRILRKLAERATYADIAKALKINVACLHAHLWRIRQITGVKSTKDIIEVREYLEEYDKGIAFIDDDDGAEHPTPAQRAILELVAKGISRKDIAERLRITPKTLTLHISQGCRRAGITCKGSSRLLRIREYCAGPSTDIDDY
jgi:DNA-binding CsgD family transcriptional regulator